MKPRAQAGGAPPRTPRGLRPCDPPGKTKAPMKAKPTPIPSRWSGLSRTRCSGAYRALGLHFHLTQPRPVWVTSLNELTGKLGHRPLVRTRGSVYCLPWKNTPFRSWPTWRANRAKESTRTGSPAAMSRTPRNRKGSQAFARVSMRHCESHHGTSEYGEPPLPGELIRLGVEFRQHTGVGRYGRGRRVRGCGFR